MPTVSIDRINLHLRGVAPATAQNALASLGPALAQALAAQPPPAAAGSVRIEQLDAVPLRVSPGVSASALRTTLARQLATTVSRQLGSNPPL